MKLDKALEVYGLKPTLGQRILNTPIVRWQQRVWAAARQEGRLADELRERNRAIRSEQLQGWRE